MSDLIGKVALITGASSGIGAATAVLFSRLGASLALTGRNEVNLQRTRDECMLVLHAEAEQPLLVIADLYSEEDVARLVDATVKRFGRLDILVNNAAIVEFDTIETTSLEQYDRIMNVNVRAAYQLTMLCVPHLIETRGNIVNVSSIAGTRSFTGLLAYSVSKAALVQLTSCTALELASKGIRVNSVNPWLVMTDPQTSRDVRWRYCQIFWTCQTTHPLGRFGELEDITQAIAFLASDNASFITGEHLHVDGGRHAACLS